MSTSNQNGVFSQTKTTLYAAQQVGGGQQGTGTVIFNATNSQQIYGNLLTVQPKSMTALLIIKT